MAKGSSGRVVIVVEPSLKRDLYVELARGDMTLKQWFQNQALAFVEQSRQPELFDPKDLPTVGKPTTKKLTEPEGDSS